MAGGRTGRIGGRGMRVGVRVGNGGGSHDEMHSRLGKDAEREGGI